MRGIRVPPFSVVLDDGPKGAMLNVVFGEDFHTEKEKIYLLEVIRRTMLDPMILPLDVGLAASEVGVKLRALAEHGTLRETVNVDTGEWHWSFDIGVEAIYEPMPEMPATIESVHVNLNQRHAEAFRRDDFVVPDDEDDIDP